MSRKLSVLIAVVLLFSFWLGQSAPLVSRAFQATPAAVVISSEVLGRATPAAVDNPELALGRVTIMPGAAIPVHYHAGTQVAVIVQGALTYTVFSGEIHLHRARNSDGTPTAIRPGETIVVGMGDALIESPGAIHQGRNEGNVPVVIYLSTLFPADAPRSVIVEATPHP